MRERSPDEAFDELVGGFPAGPQDVFETSVTIGDHPLQIRFSPPELQGALGRAFVGSRTGGAVAPLGPLLFQHVSTLQKANHPIWHSFLDEQGRSRDPVCFPAFRDAESGIFAVHGVRRGVAYCAVEDVPALRAHSIAHPVPSLVDSLLRERGLQLLHAAALGTARGAVLIVGPGGAGKSSLALQGLLAGMTYLGDDYVALEVSPRPRVAAVYRTARLARRFLDARFPELPGFSRDFLDPEKPTIFLPGLLDTPPPPQPVVAVVIPVLQDRHDIDIHPASAAHALLRLAPSTLLQLRRTDPQAFRGIAISLERLPCYTLHLGPLEDSPSILQELIEKHAC